MRLLFFTFLIGFAPYLIGQDTIKIKDGEYQNNVFYYQSSLFTGMAYSNFSKKKKKQELHFVDGYRVGSCTEWYKNKLLKEKGTRCLVDNITYKWCGLYQKWYQNGQLAYEKNDNSKGNFSYMKTWFSNGILFNEKKYINGKLSAYYSWHENGKPNEEFNFKYNNGSISYDGKWKKSSADGNVWKEKNYHLGKLEGKSNEKSIDGIIYERTYQNNLLHGKYLVSYKDSILLYEATFKNGSGIIKKYNKKGKPTLEKSYTQNILNWEKKYKKNGKIKSHEIFRINNDELTVKMDTTSGNKMYYYNKMPFDGQTYVESPDGFNSKECKYENGMFISCKVLATKETYE